MIAKSSKAIILTNAPVKKEDEELLKQTEIFKIAINGHTEYLNPDLRICSDYNVASVLLEYFPQKVVSTREYFIGERLIYAGDIPFKGSTMTACTDYLVKNNYKKILIVGDNTVRQDFFQKRINDEISKTLEKNPDVQIFQYSHGNYYLPTISVKQFITEE